MSTRRSVLLVGTIFVVLFVPTLLIVRSSRPSHNAECESAFAGLSTNSVDDEILGRTLDHCNNSGEWISAARRALHWSNDEAHGLLMALCTPSNPALTTTTQPIFPQPSRGASSSCRVATD